MAEVVVKQRTYLAVWAALLCLTALTAWLSTYDFGQWSGIVALAIATIKASLVVLFFMHIRYERLKTIWIMLLGGVFWLMLLLSGTLIDYLSRQWIGTPGR
jgi:cytochrome c oxidase subunit 4